ncbi:MAG: hypothetical protein LCH73_09090 [Proteobacteria bacterium]|nr:hypothetical protein [Pseudomonadota bacterium]
MAAERNRWPLRAVLVCLWAAPASLLGLALGLLAGGRAHRVGRTLEVALPKGWRRWLPFAALTLGQVIVGASRAELAHWRAHERVHVRQFERWGVLLLLAYPLASLWAGLRGGRPYRDNAFEREARRVAGY